MPAKAERMKQLEKFKEERELQVNLHRIIKIQALIRGAIVRFHRIPHLKYSRMAAKQVVDKLIDNYIGETYIPDILLEIVTMNKVSEDFGLYSPATQLLLEVRQSIIAEAVRDEVESVAREYINRFID